MFAGLVQGREIHPTELLERRFVGRCPFAVLGGGGGGERGLEADAVQERRGFAIRTGALDGETGDVLSQMIFEVEAEED